MFYAGGLILEDPDNAGTSPEDVFAALLAIMFAASQVGTAAAMGPDMGKAGAAAERIFRLADTPSTIAEHAITYVPATRGVRRDPVRKGVMIDKRQFQGKIEFQDVWFRYPTRKEDFVLRGLSLTINPKESVALVGESGCGKSTLVNLVMRFYDVDAGAVLVDGVNIKDYDLRSLRDNISLVMQEPIIFNYSILENVLYGKPNASNSEVYHACEISNCNEFIDGKGVSTVDDSAAGLVKGMQKNE